MDKETFVSKKEELFKEQLAEMYLSMISTYVKIGEYPKDIAISKTIDIVGDVADNVINIHKSISKEDNNVDRETK